jgi:hypothetical protein
MGTPIVRTIAVLAGAATLAVGGAAYAATGHHHAAGAKVKSAAMVAEPTLPDTDNIQSGDQTSPDGAANVQSGGQANSQAGGPDSSAVSGEQTGESGSEQVGNDDPGGHTDEPGNPNADHQFQGQE